jgi:hypothetical protein
MVAIAKSMRYGSAKTPAVAAVEGAGGKAELGSDSVSDDGEGGGRWGTGIGRGDCAGLGVGIGVFLADADIVEPGSESMSGATGAARSTSTVES